ncbi:AAA family ATPase [Rugamonas apoptosis]|uniref:ATPase AAA-type core domain-containing protein n=1 Tax=Rugamonas apoptosis TaxID=2758570 RepID=A0A7W2IMN3_9BURK|nr:ABC transporter ATP-binding protein [Rugamonas apoptosis]MBA5689809.1 hypothetical protein [Rugamonas apoptosis]
MTLLVGPNGSGKTQTLLSLGKAIARYETPEVEIDWSANGESRKTFALYFTAIPYIIDLPGDTKHFSAVHPKSTRGHVLPEVKTATDLAKEFNLSPSPTLTLTSFEKVFSFVKDLIFRPYIYRREKYKLGADWIASLVELENKITTRRTELSKMRRDNNITFEDMFNSEEYRSILNEEILLRNQLLASMEELLGEEALLRMRAVHRVTQEQRLTKDVRIDLLTRLGLPVILADGNKAQPKAEERFNHALQQLREIHKVLGRPDFKGKHYRLNVTQWEKLSKLNLNGIAQLSLAGASSGAAALLDQFARLKRKIDDISLDKSIRNLVLLIDEGDVFLHLEWQQQYVNFLDLTIEKFWKQRFDCIQIVMATHSPVLMSDFPKDCIHKLSPTTDQPNNKTAPNEMMSFGAPLDRIVRSVGGAGTLGAFATRTIRKLLADIEKGVPINQYHLDMIDDPVIKQHIQRILETIDLTAQANAN